MAHFDDGGVSDEFGEDQFGEAADDINPDGSPIGLWKLHRIKDTNQQLHDKLIRMIKRIPATDEPLPVPELIEEVQEGQLPPPGIRHFRKLTVLATGPVIVPGREGTVVRMLWDDIAQSLLREDMLASPITMRLLPPTTPGELPTLLTIIAAGANEEWESLRVMSRSQVMDCLEQNGLVLRPKTRAQLQRFVEVVLDSVDVVLYCDRLHKYHLTLADQDLIKRLSQQYGEEFWGRAVVCLTNDGYSFPPASCSFGQLVEGRVSSIAKEVSDAGIRVRSSRKGGLLGLFAGRRMYHLPSCVIDGNELFLMAPEEGQEVEAIIPDGSWSAQKLLEQLVKVANRRAVGYTHPRGMVPNEDLTERVVPVLVQPPAPKEGPKAPRQKKAPGGQLAAGMPGFPGAQKPGFGPQGAQWEMAVQQDRIRLQERRKDVESRGWLRAILGRVAASDLKWLPYVMIGQVMLYQRVLLPLINYYREKDLHYTMLEYQAKKLERQRIGIQPPRGLEVDGVYVEEPWSDGEAYVAHLKDRRRKEMAKLRQKAQ